MKKLDLERKEPLIVDEFPKGKNNLSSRATFLQRKNYELQAFSDPKISYNQPLDILYKYMFYGRTDQDQTPIQIKNNRLKQIPQIQNTVLALDFVADAFIDFRNYWISLANKGVLETRSPLYNLNIKTGWIDLNQFYYDLMSIYYNKLKLFIKNNKKDKDIRDFNTFVGVFVQFLDIQTPFLPFTRSISNISRFNSPNTSGIVLELKKEDYGNDSTKIEKYLNDPNFVLFKNTAMKYGFIIDKNAPWRIFADIDSVALKPYLDKNKTDVGNFYNEYYEKSRYLDIDVLKPYVTQMYNAYVSSKPSITEIKFEICNGKTVLKQRKTKRRKTTEKEISFIPDDVWIRFYIFIRAREQNAEMTQEHFEQLVSKCCALNKTLDERRMIDYLENNLRKPSLSSRKERNFHFSKG